MIFSWECVELLRLVVTFAVGFALGALAFRRATWTPLAAPVVGVNIEEVVLSPEKTEEVPSPIQSDVWGGDVGEFGFGVFAFELDGQGQSSPTQEELEEWSATW